MTTPRQGVAVELVLDGEAPVDAVVVDQSPGLPPAGATLAASRPATAVPSRDGDVTVASSPARL
jgi:hypothetical protein